MRHLNPRLAIKVKNKTEPFTKRVVDWWQYSGQASTPRRRRKMVKLECGHIVGPVLWSMRLQYLHCIECERPEMFNKKGD